MRKSLKELYICALCLLPTMAHANDPQSLQVVRVSPDGDDVPPAKQIVVAFNRAVTPLSDLSHQPATMPVSVQPNLPCTWRWLNQQNLACNLPDNTPLTPATQYTLIVHKGFKASDGGSLTQDSVYRFVTQRPAVKNVQFYRWKSPTVGMVRITFNQPIEKESVTQHVFFYSNQQRWPVRAYAVNKDDKPYANSSEARKAWLIEPTSTLPYTDQPVEVRVEAGLQSALGTERSVKDAHNPYSFRMYPEFRFLGIECTTNDDEVILNTPSNANTAKCNPLLPVVAKFSSPLSVNSHLKDVVQVTPSVAPWPTRTADETPPNNDEHLSTPYDPEKSYTQWLPNIKAAQSYTVDMTPLGGWQRALQWLKSWFSNNTPSDIRDIFNRRLTDNARVVFATDDRKPNYVLDYDNVVLEKDITSDIPFYVNNLKDYTFKYNALTIADALHAQIFNKPVTPVQNIQYAVPFGVRQMLNNRSGALYGHLMTNPVVGNADAAKTPDEQPSLFAQVTPFNVHVKLGHFQSIAWVVDMATGQPVANAQVQLMKHTFDDLYQPGKTPHTANTNDAGIAILPGTLTIDPTLEITQQYDANAPIYFVHVRKNDHLALLPLSHRFAIDTYRATGSDDILYPQLETKNGHIKAWGTTAQGIYKAGDTMQYKIYVRNQNNQQFIAAPANGYTLTLLDPMGKVVYEQQKLTLSSFGALQGEYVLPANAAVGWYHFELKSDAGQWQPLRVLVSDFTPSPFKVTTQLNGELFTRQQKIIVNTNAQLHAGGAYTDASTRVTGTLSPSDFRSPHPQANNFTFDSTLLSDESENANYAYNAPVFQKESTLNDKGETTSEFSIDNPKVIYGKLSVESAVSDDRGKQIANTATAHYAGVNRLVGLRQKNWLLTANQPNTIDYIVVDTKGTPVAGSPVDITIEQEDVKAARVKSAGNTYSTEYTSQWRQVGTCKGTAREEAQPCTFTPPSAGNYRVRATIKDTAGATHRTQLSTYATGKGEVVWNNGSDSSLTVIPERTDYKIGDTARYLVKNPYPNAKALITIERYGVLEQFVQTFDSATPVIEFKMKPHYVPGFYMSVLVFAPRVDKPVVDDATLGQIDLGKPTYRMGYVTVPVHDPYKEIVVTTKTEQPVYKPRDNVTVQLHAAPRHLATDEKKEPIELAVAVLDESVFDLVTGGRKAFDPYAGFYQLGALDLRNYSLLTRLVGRQRFELKGANMGGDGGVDLSIRSLFKFVGYWNPSVRTDAQGRATISFNAPDNLTGWRVLALASTPSDRFGLGEGTFKVNRSTEIRPVLPNQVTEGDQFNAGFSVMNRTDKPRTLQVDISAAGDIDSSLIGEASKKVTLEPYQRTIVWLPLKAAPLPMQQGTTQGTIKLRATAEDDSDADGIEHTLTVYKNRTLDVASTYGSTTEPTVQTTIQYPNNMLPDAGNIQVNIAPTIVGDVSGAFEYMKEYPYLCWEQQLTKALMAAHYKDLKAYLPNTALWSDSAPIPQNTLVNASAFQAPNGGMTYFKPEDSYVDPYLSAYTALGFAWLRQSGYSVPDVVQDKLDTYLDSLLKNNVAPDFYTDSMTASVRAMALSALAERQKIALSDLERFAPHLASMSLFGKSQFLKAATLVSHADTYAEQAAKSILNMASETSGAVSFTQTLDNGYSRILSTPVRDNCMALDALTSYAQTSTGKQLLGDLPFKLVRFISESRKTKRSWNNTQENLFCLKALVDFAKVYEQDPTQFTVTAALNNNTFGIATFNDKRQPAATFVRAHTATDAGTQTTLMLNKQGTGRVYYQTQLSYAVPANETQATNAGFEIHREYSVKRGSEWQMLKNPAPIKRGDVVRVDLYVSVPTERHFVVVDDAVAGGLEPVNRDLANASRLNDVDTMAAMPADSVWFKYPNWEEFNSDSRWRFYHRELRHQAVRFYADYLPAGNYRLSYTAQAIAAGKFALKPALAQEMYQPDVYGKTAGGTLQVE